MKWARMKQKSQKRKNTYFTWKGWAQASTNDRSTPLDHALGDVQDEEGKLLTFLSSWVTKALPHHHPPHLPEPEGPVCTRRKQLREKDPRRHLSLVHTCSRAKKVDWATCTPGWVAAGLQSGREKMRVSKPYPSQWVGESVFAFPGRFAWGKALKPQTIKCSGISPIWMKLVNFCHRCNCGRLDLPSTWPDSHSTSHPLATAAPFLSWRGSPSSGKNCSIVRRYRDGVGEGSLGTCEIMTWNHPRSGRRELESRETGGEQERVGGGVEMEMVPMNSSHEARGKFL